MLNSVESCLENITRQDEEIDVDGHYTEKGAKVYSAYYGKMRNGDWINEKKELLDDLLDEDDSRVLCLACGPGRTMEYLDDNYQLDRICGVDYSPEMVDLAKERNSDSVEVYQGSFLDLDFLNDEFDLVYMLGNPINHYQDSVMVDILPEVSNILEGDFVYDFIPHKDWRYHLSLEKVKVGRFTITRAGCSYNKEESEYYKDSTHMVYLIEDGGSGKSNKLNVNDVELYSHLINNHKGYISDNSYIINSIDESDGRTIINCSLE
jgi:SAM-dependent methyltransferase